MCSFLYSLIMYRYIYIYRFIYIYMYIYIYIYIYVYVYIVIYTPSSSTPASRCQTSMGSARPGMYRYICIWLCLYDCTYIYIYIYIFMYISVYLYTSMGGTHLGIHIIYIYVCLVLIIYVYICMCIYIYISLLYTPLSSSTPASRCQKSILGTRPGICRVEIRFYNPSHCNFIN
jgi:hypothetical protein